MRNFFKKNPATKTEPAVEIRQSKIQDITNKNSKSSALFRLAKEIKKHFDNLLKQEGTMTYGLKELNQGNLKTVKGIETISFSLETLNSQNNNLANEIKEMANQLKVTNNHINDSTETFSTTTQNIDDLTATLKHFSNTMKSLRQEFNEISSKVNTINEIAENTSLLALNSSIEASKAGEAGRGFAVVAKETTTLSEDTKFFSKEILNSMEDLDSLVKTLEDQVIQSTNAINQTNSMVEKSKSDLNGITTAQTIVALKMDDVLEIQNTNVKTLNQINNQINTLVTRSQNESSNLQNLINTIDNKSINYQTITNHLEQLTLITNEELMLNKK